MDIAQPPATASAVVHINPIDRWNVFNRLQELSIPCACQSGQPLRVNVDTPTSALQLWSVIQQFTASRQCAVDHLENCWQRGL